MAMSLEMNAFLEQYVADTLNNESRAKKLSNAIFPEEALGLKYNPLLTSTAMITFDVGAGNCLSFSYLFVAMAKEIGLDVQFQEIHILSEWNFTNDAIYVESRHINVRVNLYGKGDLIIDIHSVTPE